MSNRTAVMDFTSSEMKRRLDFVIGTFDSIRAYLGAVDDFGLRAALDALAHVKKIRRKAKGIERILEDVAISAMLHAGQKTYSGDGYEAILHSGASSKEWKSLEVVEALIIRTVKIRTRAYPDVDPEIIERIVRDDFAVAYSVANPSWRSTVLARLGIDAHDYCTVVPGQQSIDLRGEASYDEHNPDYAEAKAS